MPDWCDHLRRELAWLGKALGAVRDGDVLLTGLRKLAERLPPETADGVSRLLERLGDSLTDKRAELLAVLRSERYLKLLDQLANSAVELPLSDRARRMDLDSLPRLMRLIDRLFDELSQVKPDDPVWQPKVHVLTLALEHHVPEEETQLKRSCFQRSD